MLTLSQKNTIRISDNTEVIETNCNEISQNFMDIYNINKNIVMNSEKIGTNYDKIEDNKKNISLNSDEIKENRRIINLTHAEVFYAKIDIDNNNAANKSAI